MAIPTWKKLLDLSNMPQNHPDRPFFEKRATEAIERDFEASLRERGIGHVARRLLDSAHAEDALHKSTRK